MSILKNIFGKKDDNKNKSWEDFGKIAEGFEIPYLHPNHHGYPAWAGGDRYLKLLNTNWNTQIVFTQGLSSADGSSPFEIYLETIDDTDPFSSSWQANLVYEMGKILPNVKDMTQRMDKYKYLSVQIIMEGAPGDWSIASNDGNIGLFLGLPNTNLSDFRPGFTPLNIKLMRPSELQYVIDNGAEGRLKLGELYLKQGDATLSYMDRQPIL
jgi:hypothetical protein